MTRASNGTTMAKLWIVYQLACNRLSLESDGQLINNHSSKVIKVSTDSPELGMKVTDD